MISPQEKLFRDAGLSAAAWRRFLGRCREERLNLHGLLLARGETVLAELEAEELGPGHLHRWFSVSKSVTSAAIGCLAGDGLLSLDDHILDYYPAYAEEASSSLRKLRIRDMLLMRTPYSSTTYTREAGRPWVESFFRNLPDQEPGVFFLYETSAPHVLANLAEKLAGKSLPAYLHDRGFGRAGFSRDAYFIPDPQGSPLGGSGLMATLRDLYAIGLVIMQDGIFAGERVVPGGYWREATARQSETVLRAGIPEESYGYGYQFWRHRAGWACYGMGGQAVLCIPERQLLLVVTADMQKYKGDFQRFTDLFFAFLAEGDADGGHSEGYSAGARGEGREEVSCPEPETLRLFTAGDWLYLKGGAKPSAVLPEGTQTLRSADGRELSYRLEAEHLRLDLDGETLDVTVGTENRPGFLTDQKVFASACVPSPDDVYLLAQLAGEHVGFLELELLRRDGRFHIQMKHNIERAFPAWNGRFTAP